MRIWISGGRGFLGQGLVRALKSEGHDVDVCSQRLEDASPVLQTTPDVMIHAAHDFREGRSEANLAGLHRRQLEGESRGVSYQLFVSSFAADLEGINEYSQTKALGEAAFEGPGRAIARLGMVVGPSPLVSRIATFARLGIAVGTEKEKTGVIGLEDAVQGICRLVQDRRSSVFNLWNAQTASMPEVARAVRRVLGLSDRVWSVNPRTLLPLVTGAERIGLKLPLRSSSLQGLIQMEKAKDWVSSLQELGIEERPLEDLISPWLLNRATAAQAEVPATAG